MQGLSLYISKEFNHVVKKQYFTIDQAKKVLPEIKPLLKELMQLYQELGINENISVIYEEPFQETYAHVKNELFFHKKSSKDTRFGVQSCVSLFTATRIRIASQEILSSVWNTRIISYADTVYNIGF